MFESISLLTALIGSAVGAYFDLKTTEIPDEIFHTMLAVGLILVAYRCYSLWNIGPFLLSGAVGLVLFTLGYIMYRTGQWGGADAKLLGILGFLLPETPSGFKVNTIFPFPLSLLLNVFLIGAVYMLIYAVAMVYVNKKIIRSFLRDMKKNRKLLLVGCPILFVIILILNYFSIKYLGMRFDLLFGIKNSLSVLVATLSLFLIWRFAKIVEDVGFKKRIPISKLKVGDVLLTSKIWEGITKKELRKIKRSKKRYIWIKEGVRFAPTFPLALLFTLYYGDGILWLINVFY